MKRDQGALSAVTYLHGDNLGSTSVMSGAVSSAQTYYAFGAVWTTSGTKPSNCPHRILV